MCLSKKYQYFKELFLLFVTSQYVPVGPLRHPLVSLSTNRLQSTIYAVRVTVSRPKRLQTVARFEKNYRMTPLVCLTISF